MAQRPRRSWLPRRGVHRPRHNPEQRQDQEVDGPEMRWRDRPAHRGGARRRPPPAPAPAAQPLPMSTMPARECCRSAAAGCACTPAASQAQDAASWQACAARLLPQRHPPRAPPPRTGAPSCLARSRPPAGAPTATTRSATTTWWCRRPPRSASPSATRQVGASDHPHGGVHSPNLGAALVLLLSATLVPASHRCADGDHG